MHSRREKNIQLAHAVLDWNRKNLNQRSELTDETVGQCFASDFVVRPNGRHYEATLGTYREFLNGMKRSMERIEYDIIRTVADDDSVVFSMSVLIQHIGQPPQRFIAMLLIRFNGEGKVVLWEEVYLPKEGTV